MTAEEKAGANELEKEHRRDEEEAKLAAAGDLQAEEHLIIKYSGMVRAKCRGYFVMGGDKEDLVQEGMIGLMEAIRGYSQEKNMTFRNCADVCITRQILSAVRAGSRLKHAPLNTSISFEQCRDEADLILETLPDESAIDPEEQLIRKEDRSRLHESVNRLLTWQEQIVFTAYMDGYSYEKIACHMSLTVKAVDNSLQRVKRKIRLSDAWRL